MNQKGGNNKTILLDGTSSSGKTTISKYFENHSYKHISNDEYGKKAFLEVMGNLPNEYITVDEKNKLIRDAVYNSMVSESKKYNKVVFDDISQEILDYIDRDKIFIVVVYAPLGNLVRNIAKRRSESYRPLRIFEQFPKRYIKSEAESDSIDTINRPQFIKDLKKYMKYEFDSEEKLVEFANDIFHKMDIDDDDDHYIKLRDNYQYNYILKTASKNPEILYDEIKDF